MTHQRCEIIGKATLYLGDCLEILPTLEAVDSLITDPIWPTAPDDMFPGADARGLWAALCRTATPTRWAAIMGSDCDPAMLSGVPKPFFRACWLDYARPSFVGRKMLGAEIAYLYGDPPPSRPGLRVIPGVGPRAQPGSRKDNGHPCPRALEHMRFLVERWSEERGTILDPFMGSGTTGVAAVNLGRKFIGIEIEPRYFDTACERIDQAQRQGRLFA